MLGDEGCALRPITGMKEGADGFKGAVDDAAVPDGTAGSGDETASARTLFLPGLMGVLRRKVKSRGPFVRAVLDSLPLTPSLELSMPAAGVS